MRLTSRMRHARHRLPNTGKPTTYVDPFDRICHGLGARRAPQLQARKKHSSVYQIARRLAGLFFENRKKHAKRGKKHASEHENHEGRDHNCSRNFEISITGFSIRDAMSLGKFRCDSL